MSAVELKPADFEGLAAPLPVEHPAPPSPIELVVESVSALPSHPYREAPFSLVLKGPATPALAQGLVTVRHPKLGPIELFLVPIGRDSAATRYEAVFN